MTRLNAYLHLENRHLTLPALLQWSYSQHYFAEARGEEVIEHLLTLCHKPVQRKILHAQILDEQKHVHLFRSIVDRIGLDETANEFADGYVRLIKASPSLSEKIYCFQLLTEAVSAAFCQWRLNLVTEPSLLAIDREVLADETRHLGMGHCLLTICDPDEFSESLNQNRRRDLLREMNTICGKSFIKTIDDLQSLSAEDTLVRKSLFWQVSKSMLIESQKLSTPRRLDA